MCGHTAPTGRSQSVCRCLDYLHSAYPHSHLPHTGGGTSSRKRALQISQRRDAASTIKYLYDEDIKLKICLVLCMNGCRKHLLQVLPVKNMKRLPLLLHQKNWKSHSDDDDDEGDVMMTPGFWSVVSACGKTAVRESAADQPRGRRLPTSLDTPTFDTFDSSNILNTQRPPWIHSSLPTSLDTPTSSFDTFNPSNILVNQHTGPPEK